MATDHAAARQRVPISASPYRMRAAWQRHPRDERTDPRADAVADGRFGAGDHHVGRMCGPGHGASTTGGGQRADRDGQTDAQVIAGTGTNGTILGILSTAGILTVPAGALTIQGVYSAMANAIQQVHGARHMPPQAIFMHPRRWGFFQSLLDTTNRPLFPPVSQNPQNAAGILTNVASEQVVGNMQGLPIITDPNFPVNLGPETPGTVYAVAAVSTVDRRVRYWYKHQQPQQDHFAVDPRASDGYRNTDQDRTTARSIWCR